VGPGGPQECPGRRRAEPLTGQSGAASPAVGRCFAAKIGAWFERQLPVPAHAGAEEAVTFARQTNMALALAASKWLELESLDPDPVGSMRAWIAGTRGRAEARRAAARAEAMDMAGAWLEGCVREASRGAATP
jgi:hypothetical protein